MRIFNLLIMSREKFHQEKREAEKIGHKIALAQFAKADKIIYGDCQIVRGKVIKEKVVILGDKILVSNNSFENVGIEIF